MVENESCLIEVVLLYCEILGLVFHDKTERCGIVLQQRGMAPGAGYSFIYYTHHDYCPKVFYIMS